MITTTRGQVSELARQGRKVLSSGDLKVLGTILRLQRQRAPTIYRRLARELGFTLPLVHYYLRRLKAAGLATWEADASASLRTCLREVIVCETLDQPRSQS